MDCDEIDLRILGFTIETTLNRVVCPLSSCYSMISKLGHSKTCIAAAPDLPSKLAEGVRQSPVLEILTALTAIGSRTRTRPA